VKTAEQLWRPILSNSIVSLWVARNSRVWPIPLRISGHSYDPKRFFWLEKCTQWMCSSLFHHIPQKEMLLFTCAATRHIYNHEQFRPAMTFTKIPLKWRCYWQCQRSLTNYIIVSAELTLAKILCKSSGFSKLFE